MHHATEMLERDGKQQNIAFQGAICLRVGPHFSTPHWTFLHFFAWLNYKYIKSMVILQENKATLWKPNQKYTGEDAVAQTPAATAVKY